MTYMQPLRPPRVKAVPTRAAIAERRATFWFLMLASGAIFPLSYVPISYESFVIAGLGLYFLYRLQARTIVLNGFIGLIAAITLMAVAFQLGKVGYSGDTVNVRHVFRGLYGPTLFLFTMMLFASGKNSAESVVEDANRIMILMAVLVGISLVLGFRLYATGFMTDFDGSGSVAERITAGSFRIITYGTVFDVFLLEFNLILFLRTGRNRYLGIAIVAALLTLLTGSRSLIAPAFIVMFCTVPLISRSAKVFILLGLVGLMALVAVLLLPQFANAYVTRFEVNALVDVWRAQEQQLALAAFAEHPFTGLPLGVPYTSLMSWLSGGGDNGYAKNADYDLHNEYIWFLLYFGLIGSIMIVSIVTLTIARSWKLAGRRPLGQAMIGYFLVMLVAMYYSSALMKGYGALWFGMIAGLCLRPPVRSLNRPPTEPATRSDVGVRPAGPQRFRPRVAAR